MFSWIRKIFPIKREQPQQLRSEQLDRLGELDFFMRDLLSCDHYVAKSEYLKKLEETKALIDWFRVLKDSQSLASYCEKHGKSEQEILRILDTCDSLPSLIDGQNDLFIRRKMDEEEDYLNHILDDCDPKIRLDDDQRRVVLTDEDYCLVVAGAGAGKTTTVAAKVKYLVDRQGVDPKDILVISFTNKAVNELKSRIIGDLHIECPIATFHSTGNAILHINDPEKLNIVDDTKLFFVIQDYMRSSILRNQRLVDSLIMFFASYFDAPYVGKDLNAFFDRISRMKLTSMRSELDEYKEQIIDRRSRKTITIQDEMLRSIQEVQIANFLYLNGIDYEYEPIYKYHILMSRKPYTPDFRIWQDGRELYLEHFGLTEDGRNDRFSSDQLAAYKEAARQKVRLHKEHGTTLIYTYSAYNDGRPIQEHLKEELEKHGIILRPRSNREIMEKLAASEENRYIRRLVMLITRFISNFKVNGYDLDEFDRMYHSTQNARARLFLEICQDCYLEYERYLSQNSAVDFQDMINASAKLLQDEALMRSRLHFRYIIVDEYQDISRQRFDLVTALHKVTDAKIIAVGDDWQSIYAFSGSDITLFTQFARNMGYAKLLKIVRTYRNSQEVIDIAGNFIQRNPEQIQKALISPKHIVDPVIIYTYDARRKDPGGNWRSGANYAIAHAVEMALARIIEYNRKEGRPQSSDILLIGRFGFDGDHLDKSGLFEYINRGGKLRSVKYPWMKITFMTAHSSKGLGYDEVIVINGRNETYGFPSKIEDDPVLSFVIRQDHSIDYAEERRLFYVAMTRTRNRVYFIAPEQNPSEFLLELKHNYKNISLMGKWNEDLKNIPSYKKSCPVCGYPLQLRYKTAYGLRLYICTNEPEICGFMTNEIKAGKLSIMKCDKCVDGYLIVKPSRGRDDYFLGCTNYSANNKGCSNTVSRKAYYKLMGYKDLEEKTESLKPGKPAPSAVKTRPAGPANPAENTGPATAPEHISSVSTQDASAEAEAEKDADPVNAMYPDRVTISPLDTGEVMYDGTDLNIAVPTILQCLLDISENRFYSEQMLADVLRGVEDEHVLSVNFDLLDSFGKLSGMKREDIMYIIQWLIGEGLIWRTKGRYPVLHPTYKGTHYSENMSKPQLTALRQKLQPHDPADPTKPAVPSQ
jgi:DNA helicase-4